MKVFKLALAMGLAFGSSVLPVAGVAETLKDALRSAYNHSGLLHQNRALLRAADEDVAQAVAALRPVINWTAEYSYAEARPIDPNLFSLNLGFSQLLYDFGRSNLRTEALKENVLATRQSLIAIEQDVLLRAVNAFMNYRRAVEIAALRDANTRLIQQELRAARDRFEVGEITRTDVALAEARLASAKAGLAQALGDRARAVAEYVAAVGHKPRNLRFTGSLPRLPNSPNQAVATARKLHPAIRQVQHAISAAELDVERTAKMVEPTITARAGLGITDAGGGVSPSASLTMSGTLYQGGAMASQHRAAIARRDAVRAQLHSTRHMIDLQVANAYVLLDVARASAQASDQQIRAAQVAFRGVREEASLGARTTLDVLNAEQELLDARAMRISTNVDQQIAAYTVLASMGLLTAKDLRLGVKTYDPTQYYNMVKTAPAAISEQGKALDRVLKGLAGN